MLTQYRGTSVLALFLPELMTSAETDEHRMVKHSVLQGDFVTCVSSSRCDESRASAEC